MNQYHHYVVFLINHFIFQIYNLKNLCTKDKQTIKLLIWLNLVKEFLFTNRNSNQDLESTKIAFRKKQCEISTTTEMNFFVLIYIR